MLKATRAFLKENKELETSALKGVMRKIENWDGFFGVEQKEPVYFTLWEYFFRRNFCRFTIS